MGFFIPKFFVFVTKNMILSFFLVYDSLVKEKLLNFANRNLLTNNFFT